MSVAISSRLDKNRKPLFNVIGVDVPTRPGKSIVEKLNNGLFPFNNVDSTISENLKSVVKRGNFIATTSNEAYGLADVVIVSMNCDLINDRNNSVIDLDNFKNGILEMASFIQEDVLVIIESTVPPGACEKIIYPLIVEAFKKRSLDYNKFYLAHSYERVMPGENYLESIINYWRVYSGINIESAEKCEKFLSKIINIDDYPLSRLESTTSSEIGKLLENSYRAVNIAFIEEWSRFSEEVGVDLYEIVKTIRKRPTHSNIRHPGFGVGGYCLTKDPLFAKIAANDYLGLNGHDFPFSTKAVEVNNQMPLVTLDKVIEYFGGTLDGKKILLMGITYREDIGDTRFSPSEIFYNEAEARGASLKAYDPLVDYWIEIGLDVFNNLPNLSDFDAVVFTTSHKSFKKINFNEWMSNNEILCFDANNVLTKEQVAVIENKKIDYLSIGRG
tara:strand:+ start:2169 stop:3500 length:1332 start_codon:yes stop_codon:yes gene_type:complete